MKLFEIVALAIALLNGVVALGMVLFQRSLRYFPTNAVSRKTPALQMLSSKRCARLIARTSCFAIPRR